MKKTILFLLLICILSAYTTSFAEKVGITAEISTDGDINVIYISGNIIKSHENEYYKTKACLIIYDSSNTIRAIEQTDIDNGGNYEFKVSVMGDISDFKYYVRAGEEDITSSVQCSYAANSDMYYRVGIFDRNGSGILNTGDTAHVVVDITNKYKKLGEHFFIILAKYSSDNKLLGTKVSDTNTVSFDIKSAKSFAADLNITEETAYLKAFLFKDKKLIQPVTIASIRNIDSCDIYVSPQGSDDGDGSRENPLKTIEAAVKMIRTEENQSRPVNIYFEDGVYNIDSTINLYGINRTAEAPVSFRACEGAEVEFCGMKEIDPSCFKKISDISILNRVSETVQEKLVEIPLAKIGLDEKATRLDTNSRLLYPYYPPALYLNGAEQRISRWPNSGWNIFDTVIDKGGTAQSVWQGEASTEEVENHGAVFEYTDLNPAMWLNCENAYIEGFFATEYRGEWSKIKNVDIVNNTIELNAYTSYGVTAKGRWAVVNQLEEIDIPGEWCIDENESVMYWYPDHDIEQSDKISITGFAGNVINIDGISHVNFENITFGGTRGSGILIQNSDNISLKNCTVRDTELNGLVIKNCVDLTVSGCDIINTNGGADISACGNVKTLEKSNVLLENNLFFNEPGDMKPGIINIERDCVGVIIRNNTLSGSDFGAVNAAGVDTYVGYNEISNTVRNISDASAIYIGRRFSEFDSVIEYNYIHDIGSLTNFANYSTNGIFLDDLESGINIRGNIIDMNNTNYTGGIKIGGGSDNTVVGNIIINTSHPFVLEDRTLYKVTNNTVDFVKEEPYLSLTNSGIDYLAEPWISSHPGVSNLIQRFWNTGKYHPTNNIVSGNVFSADCGASRMHSNFVDRGNVTDNICIDNSGFINYTDRDYRITAETVQSYGLWECTPGPDFNWSNIGAGNRDNEPGDFSLIYPYNKMTEVQRTDCTLVWEKVLLAEEYEYTVSDTPDFSNIIEKGTVFAPCAVFEGAENGKTYYWKAVAINGGLKMSFRKESQVFEFTTAENDTVNYTILDYNIQKLIELKNSITEGSEPGTYTEGTTAFAEEAIEAAMLVRYDESAGQIEVNSAASAAVEARENILKRKNREFSVYDIHDASFSIAGTWSEQDFGYGGKSYITDDEGAAASWIIEGEGLTDYRIYYYNTGAENSDSAVTVKCSNYLVDETFTIDTSSAPEGWVELGTYRFMTEQASSGALNITFTASGTGSLSVSAIKAVKAEYNS